MRILLLKREEIEPLLSMKEVIEVVEEAFKEKGLGLTKMPPKLYLIVNEYDGDFRVMPAYLKGLNIMGVKIVSVYPKNPLQYRLPTVIAIIELMDPKTGAPLAIMDGTLITTLRTGAVGGIAVKYLARKDSEVIGIIGAGTQARSQLVAINEVLKGRIEEVRVYDVRRESSERYQKEMSEKLDLDIRVFDNPKDAVLDADIIVTTTPSRKPIIMKDWIKKGVHINAIGADAPGKEELDPMILKDAKIVVDDYEQAVHSGEVNVPISKGIISKENIYAELSEIITGAKAGRVTDKEITIFDSTGLAIQDVSTAWLAYKKAVESKIGSWIEIF